MLPLLFYLFLLWRWALSIHRAPHPSIPALIRASMLRLAAECIGAFLLSSLTCLTKNSIHIGTWCAFVFCTLSTEIQTITDHFDCSNITFSAPFANLSIKSLFCCRMLTVTIHSWRNIDIAQYLMVTMWQSHPYLATTTAPDQRGWFYLSFCLMDDMSLQLWTVDLDDLEGVEFTA